MTSQATDWARADKAAATKVARFEIGKSYVVRSMDDYDSWFRVTITARTEKTVTTDRGVCRIKVRSNWGARDETAETIKPWGNYSMCPIISADKEGWDMATHSRGPWTLQPLTGSPNGNVGARASGEHVSGYVAFVDTRWPHPEQQEEQIANARLIAAAPTLFNMVKWCVNHDGECLADHPELLEVARRAIAELEAFP